MSYKCSLLLKNAKTCIQLPSLVLPCRFIGHIIDIAQPCHITGAHQETGQIQLSAAD